MRTLPPHVGSLSRGRRAFIGIAALLLPVSLLACGPTPASTAPARQLDVTLAIADDYRYASASASMTFHRGSDEVLLLYDSVTCNGVALHVVDSESTEISAGLPRVPAGDAYRCSYSVGGARATVAVAARERPDILTPRAWDTRLGWDRIPRARPLTVTYAAASGDGVRAAAYGPHNTVGPGPGWRADTGTYEGIDVSPLYEGWGSVVVTRRYTDTPAGTGFRSGQTTYDVFASVDVAWT